MTGVTLSPSKYVGRCFHTNPTTRVPPKYSGFTQRLGFQSATRVPPNYIVGLPPTTTVSHNYLGSTQLLVFHPSTKVPPNHKRGLPSNLYASESNLEYMVSVCQLLLIHIKFDQFGNGSLGHGPIAKGPKGPWAPAGDGPPLGPCLCAPLGRGPSGPMGLLMSGPSPRIHCLIGAANVRVS